MIDKDKEEIIKKKEYRWWQKSLSITNLSIMHVICTKIYSTTQPVIHDVGDVKNAVSF